MDCSQAESLYGLNDDIAAEAAAISGRRLNSGVGFKNSFGKDLGKRIKGNRDPGGAINGGGSRRGGGVQRGGIGSLNRRYRTAGK